MEMISYYLNSSPSYVLQRVISIYHEQKLSGTPLMAMLIEDLDIDRKSLHSTYQPVINNIKAYPEDTQAKAMLSYIIYLIDYQEFYLLEDLLSREGLENFL